MSIVAIDQGTTSTRVMRVDDQGSMTLLHNSAHRQIHPQPGWVEHDPLELLHNLHDGLALCGEADALGIDNQGESCLAWHKDTLEPVSPVIVWQDTRTQSTLQVLERAGIAPIVRARSGLPLDPYFSAAKLAWILREIPAARSLANRGKLSLGTTDAFFLNHLCGRYVTDITTASRTSLMNLATGEWDDELCRLFEVPIEALPTIVPTVGDFGHVSINGSSIPLTASVVDQQAALFGHGCRVAGDTKITFGTGAFALSLTGHSVPRQPEHGLLPTVAWQIGASQPVYALDGGVYCASSAVNWARSLGLFREFGDINTFDTPSALARGLAFVPALSGLGCPHWDRSAAGLWIGLSLDTTPADMMQALLEGIALRAVEVLDAMSHYSGDQPTLSIDGGLSANPYFCQYLANLTGRIVIIQHSPELTALGTARLASHDTLITRSDNTTRINPVDDYRSHRGRFSEAVDRSRGWTQR